MVSVERAAWFAMVVASKLVVSLSAAVLKMDMAPLVSPLFIKLTAAELMAALKELFALETLGRAESSADWEAETGLFGEPLFPGDGVRS